MSFDRILSSPRVEVQQLFTNEPNEPPISKTTITQSNMQHISRNLENTVLKPESEVTETAVQHFSHETSSSHKQTLSSSPDERAG